MLVVDDREANRSLLRRKLLRLGVRVSEAGDGLEALKILAAHDVDAVCIDVDMPRLNGLELDQVFDPFDALLERHGLEKIKTVGAAYLVAGGVPEPHPDPLAACAGLGLDIVTAVAELGERLDLPLAVRVGLDAGPVVTGVVGRSRFGYDLWGEALNLASRMESTGLPGRVQVTRRVQESLADRFRFTARGPIFVKGCGELETWFLEG